MIIQCPNCGEKVVVNGLGRKPLNIPLKNVYECLKKYRSVAATANELGCKSGIHFQGFESQRAKAKGCIQRVEPLKMATM